MARKRQAETSKKDAGARDATLHVRLSAEVLEKLDAIARQNNITRSAVVAIACSRIARTGI